MSYTDHDCRRTVTFEHFADGETTVELSIRYRYYHPTKGACERGTGVPLEPDDPGEIEILEAFDEVGNPASSFIPNWDEVKEELETDIYENEDPQYG